MKQFDGRGSDLRVAISLGILRMHHGRHFFERLQKNFLSWVFWNFISYVRMANIAQLKWRFVGGSVDITIKFLWMMHSKSIVLEYS